MAKPKSQGRSQAYKLRRFETREVRKRFLLICEGTKTEPNYFKEFRSNQTVVEAEGYAQDPKGLVNTAIKRRNEERLKGQKFDEVWCVFDRDDVPPDRFNAALSQAAANNIKVAYSNEAFELWYVLHFEYLNAEIPRKDYQAKIAKHLGLPSYKKNDPSLYARLLGYRKDAIRNAARLLESYPSPNPAQDNPSTTIHLLVEALLGR